MPIKKPFQPVRSKEYNRFIRKGAPKKATSRYAKKSASPKPQQNENPKYAMRTWLLRLGFIGEEFETARDILTRRLSGDAAFRNGRAAA